jgi:hypothetical protein
MAPFAGATAGRERESMGVQAVVVFGALAASVVAGAGGAWWLHRRTRVSPGVVYLGAALGVAALAAAAASLELRLMAASAPLAVAGVAGAAVAQRLRLAASGAGGELRDFERHRLGAWTALRARTRQGTSSGDGDRTYIAGQGELVRERGWPTGVPHIAMTGDGRGLVPCAAGAHVLIVGATGSGKTVSARRWLLARVARDGVGALVCDPKGDRGLERDLRRVARLVGRPLVVFDPRDPATDRWNPLWSEDTGAVVSRVVAPIAAGNGNARYYADLLQIHLGTVAAGLRAAELWPANLPLLLDAAQLGHYDQLLALVRQRHGASGEITRRLREHRVTITTPEARRDLTGGILRLRVITGEAWRPVLTPDPQRGAVTLPAALAAGAIVLVRTWVDDLPDEARAITTLFLADAAAAALALPHGTEWVALIDELGGVLSAGAGERALALMQRARSAGGQVAVSTQSVTDFPAATGNPALLDALADNFSAGIFHRQSSPESRDWLARLIGTREVWQLTDRTSAGRADGAGSRRRVREFLARPDEFRTLRVGEAYVWSSLGPAPDRITITPAQLPDTDRGPGDRHAIHRPCGPTQLDTRSAALGDHEPATAPAPAATRDQNASALEL